jgi:hypothetical protein
VKRALRHAVRSGAVRSAANVRAFCDHAARVHPGSVSFAHSGEVVGSAHAATQVCFNVGCAWDHFWGIGDGFMYDEYGANPYPEYGCIYYGYATLTWHNYRRNTNGGWNEGISENYGCDWRSYRTADPWCGEVSGTLTGWTYLTTGILAYIGPATEFNFIAGPSC